MAVLLKAEKGDMEKYEKIKKSERILLHYSF